MLRQCWLQEVSNPFLHLRFILRALRKGNQQLMLVNDAAFALSFFICRLLLGPFVVWATVASPTTPWTVKVGAFTLASKGAHMHQLASGQAVLHVCTVGLKTTAFAVPLLQLGGVGIFVVSLFWASKILRMIQRTVFGGSKQQKS